MKKDQAGSEQQPAVSATITLLLSVECYVPALCKYVTYMSDLVIKIAP